MRFPAWCWSTDFQGIIIYVFAVSLSMNTADWLIMQDWPSAVRRASQVHRLHRSSCGCRCSTMFYKGIYFVPTFYFLNVERQRIRTTLSSWDRVWPFWMTIHDNPWQSSRCFRRRRAWQTLNSRAAWIFGSDLWARPCTLCCSRSWAASPGTWSVRNSDGPWLAMGPKTVVWRRLPWLAPAKSRDS